MIGRPMEDEGNPRVVLLSDWHGTVVGLAYDPDSLERDESSSNETSPQETGQGIATRAGNLPTDQLQWSLPRSVTEGASPRAASHVLDRLRVVVRKCLVRRTVEELVEKLFAQDLHAKERAACELADLSHSSREYKLKIAETPRALDGLVNLLQLNSAGVTPHEVECAKAQREATRALVSLASEQENRWIISEYPYALSGLVKVLMISCESEARKWAAQALGHLCVHSQEVRLKIGQFPHALAALVRLIDKDGVEAVREQAARTLGILMRGHVEHKRKIATVPNAIEALVKMLAPKQSAAGQKMGALCLAHLDHSEEILLEIASTPGVLTSLVGLLSTDERARHKLEYGAAGNASRHHHHLHLPLHLHFPHHHHSDSHRHEPDDEEAPPDKLATLVGVLLNQDNVSSQKRTAVALAKIYSQERPLRKPAAAAAVSLGCSRRSELAFEQMILDEREGVDIEARAVSALNFLAAAREKKLLMSDYPNVMLGTVGPLLRDGTRQTSVAAFAAMVLASLARAHRNRKRIAECYGALAGLIKLLAKNDCPMAQAAAACALANIAHEDRQVQYTVTRVPNCNAVASLIALLLKRENHNIQSQAARALACLVSVRDRDNNLVVVEQFPNILTDLARSLFQSDVPSVQEEAAWALVNIGHRQLGH